jgi:hydroxyacylglutathione hydrolase
MILKSIQVGLFQENCYVVGDESSGIGAIVDPGDEAARIALLVEQTGLEIEQILLTHAHIDHVGAVADLADEYACPVLAHAGSGPVLKALPQQAVMMGIRPGRLPDIDREISADGTVEVGGLRFEALYTPGHAPGHLAFYEESEAFVVSGDTVFAGSIGRTDLPGGSTELLMRSIEEKLLTLPDETRVCPGHGPETTIGEERTNNPFLKGSPGE